MLNRVMSVESNAPNHNNGAEHSRGVDTYLKSFERLIQKEHKHHEIAILGSGANGVFSR